MFSAVECNLGYIKLEPMLSAGVCDSHAQGFAFKGFLAVREFVIVTHRGLPLRAFLQEPLHGIPPTVYLSLPTLLTIVEYLFAPTPPTLSCLHRVTVVITWLGKYFH